MATVTPGYTFTNNEVVTPTKLNSAATPVVSNIVTADVVDANVTTAKIADANVTTAKIADANVTLAKLVSSVQQALMPSGAVQAFAMNSAPIGWLDADGSLVSRVTYAALFSAIGTTYGVGNGSTTFTLPDLRGYFVRGVGTNSDGAASGGFGVKQSDALQNITGKLGVVGNQPAAGFGGSSIGALFSSDFNNSGGAGGGGSSGNSGYINFDASLVARTSNETRPKNISLLYCIKT